MKYLLVLLFCTSCILVARPQDIVPEPYCQPVHQDVLLCRDGHYGDLWRCVYHGGRWRCTKV